MLEVGWESRVKLLNGRGGGGKARNCLYVGEGLEGVTTLVPCTPLKNCNCTLIRLIKLCLMNHPSGAKLESNVYAVD